MPHDKVTIFQALAMVGDLPMYADRSKVKLNTHIDHYAEINFESFAEIIDILGGVTIDVEQRTPSCEMLILNTFVQCWRHISINQLSSF